VSASQPWDDSGSTLFAPIYCQNGSQPTPANDAGLVADALGAAGFAVTGARNLDQAALRGTFREFIGQVASAGPNAVAVIYLAGFGLQFEGENYFAIRAIRER